MTKPSPSSIAWLGLAGYVIAADSVLIARSQHTLSTAARLAVRHPRRRPYVVAAWALLTAHLCRPDAWSRFDPITVVGTAVTVRRTTIHVTRR